MTVWRITLLVSISGLSPLTVTMSLTTPNDISGLIVAVKFVEGSIPWRVNVVKSGNGGHGVAPDVSFTTPVILAPPPTVRTPLLAGTRGQAPGQVRCEAITCRPEPIQFERAFSQAQRRPSLASVLARRTT
jgi:hypothetical protein